MRLASIAPSTSGAADVRCRDGQLVLISSDSTHCAIVPQDVATCFQAALDEWEATTPKLRSIATALERNSWPQTIPIEQARFLAPLPRSPAFLDGSAFLEHVLLARKARNAAPPADLNTVPLMYQGMSDSLLPGNAAIPLFDSTWGLDFEAEVAVILGDVPQGTRALDAAPYIRAIVLLNDFTYRGLVLDEIGRGFGFLQSKPASSFGPFAITPDELGDAWQNGRINLPVVTMLNGKRFGNPSCAEMHFSFFDLIAHACRTRPLSAGTILGSGTVANSDRTRGHSCIVEKRAVEQIETGAPTTPYLKIGDRFEIFLDLKGSRACGTIAHTVVTPAAPSH